MQLLAVSLRYSPNSTHLSRAPILPSQFSWHLTLKRSFLLVTASVTLQAFDLSFDNGTGVELLAVNEPVQESEEQDSSEVDDCVIELVSRLAILLLVIFKDCI